MGPPPLGPALGRGVGSIMSGGTGGGGGGGGGGTSPLIRDIVAQGFGEWLSQSEGCVPIIDGEH